MPELPEVETIARELRPLVRDAVVAEVWTDWPRAIRHPDPAAFGAGLVGRRIVDVARRAKWLVLTLDGGAMLVIQVKMTGQLLVVDAAAPRDRHVHVAWRLADGRELRLRDTRKFARVGLYRAGEDGLPLDADETGALFAGHGPEPLEPSFTLGDFRRRLRARRGRLKPLLLDQAFLAGVGNIYADEALWRARLHPLRGAASLRRPDEARLFAAIRGVLTEAIERRGSSTTPRRRATARCRSTWTSTSAPACRAIAAGGRSAASSWVAAARTSARGASACRGASGRRRWSGSCGPPGRMPGVAGCGTSCRSARAP